MKMVCVMTAGTAAQLHTSVIIHQIVYWKLVRFLVYKLHLDEVTEQGKRGVLGLGTSFAKPFSCFEST